MITEEQYRLAKTRHRAFSEVLGKYEMLLSREDECLHNGTLTEPEHLAVCRGISLARSEVKFKLKAEAQIISQYEEEQKEKLGQVKND